MSAIISDCGLYRYRLERDIGPGRTACVIMVNPSTADAEEDDATIRKVRGFAARNDIGRIIVVNLFAYRAKKVEELRRVEDPVGPENMEHVSAAIRESDITIAAWGPVTKQPKRWRSQWRRAWRLAHANGKALHAIGVAKCGHPRHPLMTPYTTPITAWETPR